jgi:hypothetical protein
MVQYIPGYTGGWQHPRSDGNMDSTAKIPGMKGPKESLEEETRRGLIVPFRLPAASIDSCCRTVCGRVHVDEVDVSALYHGHQAATKSVSDNVPMLRSSICSHRAVVGMIGSLPIGAHLVIITTTSNIVSSFPHFHACIGEEPLSLLDIGRLQDTHDYQRYCHVEARTGSMSGPR